MELWFGQFNNMRAMSTHYKKDKQVSGAAETLVSCRKSKGLVLFLEMVPVYNIAQVFLLWFSNTLNYLL